MMILLSYEDLLLNVYSFGNKHLYLMSLWNTVKGKVEKLFQGVLFKNKIPIKIPSSGGLKLPC